MENPAIFSGIMFILLTLHNGYTVCGLQCVNCEWKAGDLNSNETCLSAPNEEKFQTCEKNDDGITYICSIKATFNSEMNDLVTLIRDCRPKHYKCNNRCVPPKNAGSKNHVCNICCENELCNTFPIKATISPSVYINNGSIDVFYYGSKTLTILLFLVFLSLY